MMAKVHYAKITRIAPQPINLHAGNPSCGCRPSVGTHGQASVSLEGKYSWERKLDKIWENHPTKSENGATK